MSVLIQSLEKETKQKKRRVGRPSNPETLHPSETSQAFLKFKESLDTSEPDTQNSYIRWLCQFMKFCQVGDNADLLLFDNGSNPKIIEDKIRKFLLHQLDKGKSQNSRHAYFQTLKRFYEFNDVLSINWTRLKTYVGKSRGSKAILRAYNHEEIRKLLQAARSERDRVIVLLMCSAGLRAGALPELKVSDLKYNPECNIYRILSYSESDSNHRYVTWCSPECANAINEMLDFRRRCGEVIKDSSPLIRKEFDKDSKKAVANAQELNVRAVERVLYMLAYDAGLRTKENKVTRLGDRHNTSQCHSLRRFFKTQATASGVDQLWSALLLGHGAKNSLEGRYDTPSEDMLLDAYIKAIPHLTIGSNEETRLKQKLGIVEAEKEQIRLTFEKRFEEYQASMNAKFDAINKMLAEAAKQQK